MKLKIYLFVSFLFLVPFKGFANEINQDEAKDNFIQGQIHYKEGEHDAAVIEFTNAIKKSPDNSQYHHWLAKTYGELAEESGWLKAMRLAENSRDALKRSVELDPENISALTDLMRYYQQAPSFLGGSETKAGEISIQLEILKKKNIESIDNPSVSPDEQNG